MTSDVGDARGGCERAKDDMDRLEVTLELSGDTHTGDTSEPSGRDTSCLGRYDRSDGGNHILRGDDRGALGETTGRGGWALGEEQEKSQLGRREREDEAGQVLELVGVRDGGRPGEEEAVRRKAEEGFEQRQKDGELRVESVLGGSDLIPEAEMRARGREVSPRKTGAENQREMRVDGDVLVVLSPLAFAESAHARVGGGVTF